MRQATSSEAHVLGTSAQSLLFWGPPFPVRRRRAAAAWGRKVAGGSMALGPKNLEVLT